VRCQKYIYLHEPDLEAGIENWDERNWLLATAPRDCQETCHVFGGELRCWILCGKIFHEGVRDANDFNAEAFDPPSFIPANIFLTLRSNFSDSNDPSAFLLHEH